MTSHVPALTIFLLLGRSSGTLGRFAGMWDVLLGRERALLTSHVPQKNYLEVTVGRYLFLNSRPCTDTLLAQSTPPASLGRLVHKRTFISEVSVVFSNPLSMRVEYRVSLIFVATHSNPVDSKSIILVSHLDRAFVFSGNVNKWLNNNSSKFGHPI